LDLRNRIFEPISNPSKIAIIFRNQKKRAHNQIEIIGLPFETNIALMKTLLTG
jgi:hypothetical protein